SADSQPRPTKRSASGVAFRAVQAAQISANWLLSISSACSASTPNSKFRSVSKVGKGVAEDIASILNVRVSTAENPMYHVKATAVSAPIYEISDFAGCHSLPCPATMPPVTTCDVEDCNMRRISMGLLTLLLFVPAAWALD